MESNFSSIKDANIALYFAATIIQSLFVRIAYQKRKYRPRKTSVQVIDVSNMISQPSIAVHTSAAESKLYKLSRKRAWSMLGTYIHEMKLSSDEFSSILLSLDLSPTILPNSQFRINISSSSAFFDSLSMLVSCPLSKKNLAGDIRKEIIQLIRVRNVMYYKLTIISMTRMRKE